jgi:hypothetical protein
MAPMLQALEKHIDRLVALPDGLCETTIWKYKKLCDNCGCYNERELAAALEEEQRPRAITCSCDPNTGLNNFNN